MEECCCNKGLWAWSPFLPHRDGASVEDTISEAETGIPHQTPSLPSATVLKFPALRSPRNPFLSFIDHPAYNRYSSTQQKASRASASEISAFELCVVDAPCRNPTGDLFCSATGLA